MRKKEVVKVEKVEPVKKEVVAKEIVITELPEVVENPVTMTITFGKSTVTVKTTVKLFKQDVWSIWDKAMADLDELNANA